MPIRVLDEWATARAVKERRLSLARFGDGEIKLATGRDCKTQPASPLLAAFLRTILQVRHAGLLVAVPRIFEGEPPFSRPGFWPQHKAAFEAICPPRALYGSAFVTRRDAWAIPDESAYWDLWRSVWADRPVLLVTGSGKGRATRDALLGTAASVEVLPGPRPDAWSRHDALFSDCLAWADRRAGQEPCVVLALGATATVLAHRLSVCGVQALDLGHAAQAAMRVSPKELAEA